MYKTTMAEKIIDIQNLHKSFGKFQALSNLSLSVEKGEVHGFLGPNGAGKTTMMKMIYARCHRDPDPQSNMNLFGYDPAQNELDIKFLSGVVSQEDNLDEELNVYQNLRLFARF
ncbi:MAG TPA: ATP-binding cassette domain-containing protein, partial [Candidatus Saccharibacteria bacterium]|nr:ATP-binding cassette domain-containing protein [Candidatus Saccharibacteria bacterium]